MQEESKNKFYDFTPSCVRGRADLIKSLSLFWAIIVSVFQQHIEAASDALKQCITVCSRYRKKNTLSESLGMKKTNYDQYSPGKLYNMKNGIF
jgi:hypothetical protein